MRVCVYGRRVGASRRGVLTKVQGMRSNEGWQRCQCVYSDRLGHILGYRGRRGEGVETLLVLTGSYSYPCWNVVVVVVVMFGRGDRWFDPFGSWQECSNAYWE